jgi:hypothetical protein
MKHRTARMSGMSLVVLGLAPCTALAIAPQYAASPLGQPAGATSYSATRMSSDGHWVAGRATFGDGSSHPVVWHDAVPTIIPNVSGSGGIANDVNNSGLVVGQSNGRAFAYQGGTLTPLPVNTSWYSEARGVNNAGYIVGQSGGWGGFGDQYRAVAWASSSSPIFDVHGAASLPNGSFYTGSTGARDVSDSGVVGGFIEPNTYHGAFTYNSVSGASWWGEVTDFDGEILALNNEDGTGVRYVVGYWPGVDQGRYVYQLTAAETAAGQLDRSGSWHNTLMFPQGVTSYGDLVGSWNNDAYIAAFTGSDISLDTLLVPGSDVNLNSATDINNAGVIVANGIDGSGFSRAYLLTPAVPEPVAPLVSIVLLALGAQPRGRKKPIVLCMSRD